MNILRQDQQPEPRAAEISKDWRAWATKEGYVQGRTIPVTQGNVSITLEVWANPIAKDPFLLYHPPIPNTEETEVLYILEDQNGMEGMLEVTTQMAAMVMALAQDRTAFQTAPSSEQEGPGQPPRDQVIMEATYYTARSLYYDTCEQAQREERLTITMMDMAHVEPSLPRGVTHRFYVILGESGYSQYGTAAYVNRTQEGYVVEPDASRDPRIKQELDIREAVLDAALEHFLGHSPYPNGDLTQKPVLIERLLLGTQAEVKHPVVSEMAPESERALRQWTVQVGDRRVKVGMFLVKGTENEVRFQVLDS
jgi:hypothetical protein